MKRLWLKLPVPLQGFFAVALLLFGVGFMGPFLISSGNTFLALLGGVGVYLLLWLAIVLAKWTVYDAFQSDNLR